VLVATAAGEQGGPAAAQGWDGGTVLGRLLDQFAGLGVTGVHVITRGPWAPALEPSLGARGARARMHTSESAAGDLRAVAAIARAARGAVVVGYADIVTQGEVLAGLLIDPRVATGILATVGRIARPFGFRVRSRRGRVVSAGSPYHAVRAPNGTFLGILKVSPSDRGRLVAVAERLAKLVDGPLPEGWDEELAVKEANWRRILSVQAMALQEEDEGDVVEAGGEEEEPPPDHELLVVPGLSPEADAEIDRRRAGAADDVTALLLVGLVRDGVLVGHSRLRNLFWARPLSAAGIERAAGRIGEHDEEKALLDSAVKGSDGFFTTFFVSPYSKYIARWAAHHGLTPNQVTMVSVAVGLLAAVAFATGERWGLVSGAVLLQAAFTLDCVDGQLARYSRQFSKLGAWLDSIFDRTKEYVVFAGLAIGASRTGDPVWLLAGAALAMQTTRHAIDFSYPASQHQAIAAAPQPPIETPFDSLRAMARTLPEEPVDAEEPGAVDATLPASAQMSLRRRLGRLWRAGDRNPQIRWIKKIIAFPIGERFAAISITAALFSAHTTFVVLLAWGGLAMVWVLLGRTLRSLVS
jgi:hypothetical protein